MPCCNRFCNLRTRCVVLAWATRLRLTPTADCLGPPLLVLWLTPRGRRFKAADLLVLALCLECSLATMRRNAATAGGTEDALE